MKKKDDKIEYELCPRCELNYKPKKQRYCDICNAALKANGDSLLLPDEDEESEKLCPICRVNYMNPDEEMCFMCQKDRARESVDEDDSWRDFLDDEEPEPLEELDVSFEELAKEEEMEDDDEEFEDEGEDDFEYVDPDEEDYEDEEEEDDDEE
ncbi:hypothetical protein FACS1894211_11920 [Clostridia bacterium]|nr:hypothetical protein FACS1894211_11920 [Clostridia bacterium]